MHTFQYNVLSSSSVYHSYKKWEYFWWNRKVSLSKFHRDESNQICAAYFTLLVVTIWEWWTNMLLIFQWDNIKLLKLLTLMGLGFSSTWPLQIKSNKNKRIYRKSHKCVLELYGTRKKNKANKQSHWFHVSGTYCCSIMHGSKAPL